MIAAMRLPKSDTVISWHIGMLKLLPFLRGRHTHTIQMLHGIECWRPLDPVTARLASRVTLFLSNSEHTWKRFVEFNPQWRSSKHSILFLGLGDGCPEPQSPSTEPFGVIVGRMNKAEDYKGHRQLIQAWSRVREQIPSASLHVIGEGDHKRDLMELACRCGVGDSIIFHGAVDEARKTRLLRDSRALLMPSKGEGFGLVYLEAMRLGRPCLVSTCDSGQEVVNPPEAGLAVDPDDRQALPDAIVRLMTAGPEWTEWSEQARQRYSKRFTMAQYQTRLKSLLAML